MALLVAVPEQVGLEDLLVLCCYLLIMINSTQWISNGDHGEQSEHKVKVSFFCNVQYITYMGPICYNKYYLKTIKKF